MKSPIVTFNRVYKSFQDNPVLKNFNLTIGKGESFTLMGRSGSGKSVAMKCLLGLLTHDKGKIVRDQHIVRGMEEGSTSSGMENVGVVFQGSALFDSMSVGENIALALRSRAYKKEASLIKTLVLRTLSQVGLSHDIIDLMPSEISGGMAKRVAIARAIVHKPNLLLLDEPTTGLDPLSVHLIGQLIHQLHHQSQTTTLTITHDLHLARMISTHIGVLEQGKIVWNGHFEDMPSAKVDLVREMVVAQKL
ncbi:ABC transporter ATP-binding protein [Candidatus Hepatobacter penaei]|uniref:ABC transporter ATP-binding protein n=1 Tax=Candidatus Hepatobacter penaei TaxID=1274402 RepID=UPI00069712D1|nr:ATP-binding cassette domain-containing protein [Candidatus Hepatobacter penaei]TGW15769.1 ATP-binding cassette domain-containing protein [bacterium NHP-B]